MPHIIKKFVNAMERSGDEKNNTNLIFNKEKISLNRLYKIWLESEMCGDLRNSKLTPEHFAGKNPHNRMRSFLVFQVCSNSMIELIKSYANRVDGTTKYISTISILKRDDRLIDIVNSTMVKKCEPIKSPNHRHIDELEEILKIFCEWKSKAVNNNENFLPLTTFEDIIWLCVRMIALCRSYSKILEFQQNE